MIRLPAQFRDIPVYAADMPLSWDVPLTRNGLVEDLSDSTIEATLTDDGIEIGQLGVDLSKGTAGIVTLTLTQELYDQIHTYSSWTIKESPVFNGRPVRGRLVKRV
jgi:hypothetical protein